MAASTTRTVKAKFDGDAKGLVAAAAVGEKAIDKFGNDTEKKFRKSGEKASRSFGQSIKRWFKGEGGGLFKQIGENGGTVFGSGLLGAIKTPILGPAILAAMAAAVAIAAPAAGAIAGTGLVAGFGAGLAGLGITFAAKSQVVQDKWKQTLAQLGADMRLLSVPWESTLIGTADVFERTVDAFNPALQRAYAKMAPTTSRFVDQTGRAFEELVPTIDPVAEAFDAVLDSLGPALQDALHNVASGIIDVANSVKQNPEALADTVRGIGTFTREALELIRTLNDVNGKIDQMTGGFSAVDGVFTLVNSTLQPLLVTFKTLEQGIDAVNALTHSTDVNGQSMSEAANNTVKLAQAYRQQQGAAKGTVAPNTDAAAAVAKAKQQAAEAAQKFEALISAMFRTQNAALTLSGAQISLQAAIDGTAASVKANGRTLDINTEKGRNNRSALNDLARAANDQTESMIRSGKSTATAAATAATSRTKFVQFATQMGLNKKQAQALAAQLIAIPNVSREAKLKANKADLDAKLAAAKRQLADKSLTATKRASLEATIAQLERQVANARAAIASVQGKTVFIDAIVRQRGQIKAADPRLGAPGRASGGLTQPNRTYLVGERGPELWSETRGGRITNAEDTARMLAGLNQPSTPIVVENHIEIGGEVVRVVRTEIKASDRDTKRRTAAGVRAA